MADSPPAEENKVRFSDADAMKVLRTEYAGLIARAYRSVDGPGPHETIDLPDDFDTREQFHANAGKVCRLFEPDPASFVMILGPASLSKKLPTIYQVSRATFYGERARGNMRAFAQGQALADNISMVFVPL